MSAILARALLGLLLVGTAAEQLCYEKSAKINPAPIAITNALQHANDLAPSTNQEPIQYDSNRIYRICRVTAYCDRGLTASGTAAGEGQCAAPADIPFGSRIHIPELGRTFIVTDRTARRFRHNTVDLFIPARKDCMRFGRRYLECEIAVPAESVRYGSPVLREALSTIKTPASATSG